MAAQRPFTQEELQELKELEEAVRRFERKAREYREEAHRLIESKYRSRRDFLHHSYEKTIAEHEAEQRRHRETAIVRFERFLKQYPAHPGYTPDAMFRLSELYFERSYDTFLLAQSAYEEALTGQETDDPEPAAPDYHYEPTIAMMQRLIDEFPTYRLLPGAYYLLGYCLAEQGEAERAVDVYQQLLARYPRSRFSPEVWTRLGEHYFDANELGRALAAYRRVLVFQDSPFYDKALYKLAWTYYRMADPVHAPRAFNKAVDAFATLLDFNERSKAAGRERGGDLRAEAILYMAICFADEGWGSIDRALAYFDNRGGVAYEREVLTALGKAYLDQTRFAEAAELYSEVRRRFPLHRDGPTVQGAIVLALERERDFAGAAEARRDLLGGFGKGSTWYEANAGDHEALASASDLIEKSLYAAAVFHHQQAQMLKAEGRLEQATRQYAKAAEAYGGYIVSFPHDRQLYELTYYHAEALYYSLQFTKSARRYAWVRDSTADTKFREEAALNAVLAYENAIKMAEARGELQRATPRKSTERTDGAPVRSRVAAQLKRDLIEAVDRYAQIAPRGERTVALLYKAAEICYVHDDFREARRRFEELLARSPEHETAEYASNWIIESYLVEKNFAAVEVFTRKLLALPRLAGGASFRGELVKFQSGAVFKMAEQHEQADEHEAAAEAYLKLLDEAPQSEFAAPALNNAAVAYEKAGRYALASDLYARLVREHPGTALAAEGLFRMGVNAEHVFDFDKAVESYWRLMETYPGSEHGPDALYNAAVCLENTHRYKEAARAFGDYCELFPERDDAASVCLRAGLVYQKMGEPKAVIRVLERYLNQRGRALREGARVAEALLRIGQAHEAMGHNRRAARKYRAVLAQHDREHAESSAPFAAEAAFTLAERELAQFAKIRIAGRSKQQRRALKRKAERLKAAEEAYKAVLGYKQMDWTLASMFRIGQLYHDFAESLFAASCPPDVARTATQIGATADEVCSEYHILIEEQAAKVEDKAVMAYETAVGKASEFQVANSWTKRARDALRRLRPGVYPADKHLKSYLDELAVGPAPIAVLRESQQRLPDDLQIQASLAGLLARRRVFDEAEALAISVLERDAGQAQALVALGTLHRHRGNYELSRLALSRALQADDASGEALNELGLVFHALGEKAKAAEAFERAVAAAPEAAAPRNNLGVVRTEVGDFDGAVQMLGRAVAMRPDKPEYQLNLGNALRGAQRHPEAVAAYERALQLGRGLPDARYNLGVLYLDVDLPHGDKLARLRLSAEYLRAFLATAAVRDEEAQQISSLIVAAEQGAAAEKKRLRRQRQRKRAAE